MDIKQRVRDKSLHKLITTADKLIPELTSDIGRVMNIGWSGFTPAGYPKVMPVALADYVEANNLQGKVRYNLFVGASSGAECDDRWAMLNMIDRRWPYQTGKNLSKGINSGQIRMGDKHLSMFAQDLFYGFYTPESNGKLDYGFIEASAITEDGNIVLTGAVGISPEVIAISEKLIIEVNTALPSFEGMHDIFMQDKPPHKRVIPLTSVSDRIGTTYVPTDKSKIIAIVESDRKDKGRVLKDIEDSSRKISDHIIEFLQHEVKMGRLPKNLLPLQSGVGSIANAVVSGLTSSPFKDLEVFTEVLQDGLLPFLDSGTCKFISCTSLSLSPDGFQRWWDNYEKYKEMVIVRPQSISNHPEVIRRLGVISMNTPIELDIYGHANSTLINGVRMVNGIGGSGDFLRNSYLSIMHSPSVRSTKTDEYGISCLVPQVTHVDHTEHDLDILVTDQGLADIRGLSPKDRAVMIINKCAHPAYKDYLTDYLDRAIHATKNAHEPQLMAEVYKMHLSVAESGSMRFWKK